MSDRYNVSGDVGLNIEAQLAVTCISINEQPPAATGATEVKIGADFHPLSMRCII